MDSSPPALPSLPARRKDRRGKGPRGPLLPHTLPGYRTRAQIFDAHLIDVLHQLPEYWRDKLEGMEFAVELVPPSRPAAWEAQQVRLGRVFPADVGLAPRIVLYRRPIETRAHSERELQSLIQDVLLEQVAAALNVQVEDLETDPRA